MQSGMGTSDMHRASGPGPGRYLMLDKWWPSSLPPPSLLLLRFLCISALLAYLHSHMKWKKKNI